MLSQRASYKQYDRPFGARPRVSQYFLRADPPQRCASLGLFHFKAAGGPRMAACRALRWFISAPERTTGGNRHRRLLYGPCQKLGCWLSASNLHIGDMLTIVDAQDTAQTPLIEGIQPTGRSLGHRPRFSAIDKDWNAMYVKYRRIFVAVVMLDRQTFRSNAL